MPRRRSAFDPPRPLASSPLVAPVATAALRAPVAAAAALAAVALLVAGSIAVAGCAHAPPPSPALAAPTAGADDAGAAGTASQTAASPGHPSGPPPAHPNGPPPAHPNGQTPAHPSGRLPAHPNGPPAGAARPVVLPHHVVDGRTGARLDDAAVDARLLAARVVFVGEEHSDPHHHGAEIEVLERVHRLDPRVGLGLEMLPHPLQPPLTAYVTGVGDEGAFLAAVDWRRTWGFDFGLYRPLLAFCRQHRLPAFALNAPRALAHAVAARGLAALDAAQRAALPEIAPGPEAHRLFVQQAFGAHDHGGLSFENFYAAQLVWDETMATRIVAALAAAPPGGPTGAAPARLVVVAGYGHTRPYAVPERVVRRGVREVITVLPVTEADAERAVADRVADLLWVLEPRAR